MLICSVPCRKPCEDLEMWEKFATFVAEFKNMVMGEDVIPFFNEVKDTMQGIIKVVGVGGGGCNAVRNMYNEGVAGVTYAASYYIISSHTQKHIAGSNRIWYERLKVIRLPRELVVKNPVKII